MLMYRNVTATLAFSGEDRNTMLKEKDDKWGHLIVLIDGLLTMVDFNICYLIYISASNIHLC